MAKKLIILAVAALGAAGGWLYYSKVGCISGQCPITSNPVSSIIYGAVLGAAVANLFTGHVRDRNEPGTNREQSHG
jgi:hypothetical protein